MSSATWQRLSVREFWGRFNWEGCAVATRGGGGSGLSLRLSVGQYFALMPWEGQARVAAVAVAPAPVSASRPEATEELATLEDFLGDVSAFF